MEKIKFVVIFIFALFLLSFGAYKATFALFSSTATSTNNVFSSAAQFPKPIATTLVFNEFVYNTTCGNNASQNASNYWIELFNGSAQTVDLKDWRFRDGAGATIQISNAVKTVLSGQYVIITKDGSVFNGNTPCFVKQGTPVEANLGGNSDFLPATTGGVVRLEQPDGVGGFITVDRVEYGPTLNGGVLNAPAMHSVARMPNGIDTALGDTFNVSDFTIDGTPSPGVAN